MKNSWLHCLCGFILLSWAGAVAAFNCLPPRPFTTSIPASAVTLSNLTSPLTSGRFNASVWRFTCANGSVQPLLTITRLSGTITVSSLSYSVGNASAVLFGERLGSVVSIDIDSISSGARTYVLDSASNNFNPAAAFLLRYLETTPNPTLSVPATGTSATSPGAPNIGIATAGNTTASVMFTPPSNNGGSAITSYRASSTPSGLTGNCTVSPCTVSGLSNGTTYTFRVTATNAIGTSVASAASNSVTPMAAPSTQMLTVTRSGASGTVNSSPVGINHCGGTCSALFSSGTSVNLTASPSAGSVFAGWSGSCSGTQSECTVVMSQARSVGAAFNSRPVSVALQNGVGVNGSVNSSTTNSDYRDYTVTLPTGVAQLSIGLTNLSADIDLYVRVGSPPTTEQSDCQSVRGGTDAETCAFINPAASTYHIRAYGFDTAAQTFRITANWSLSTGTGTPSYAGAWYKPTESGWGLTVAQQGDVLFPNWFTFDSDGKPLWFGMLAGARPNGAGGFSGSIFRTRGIPFSLINGQQAFGTLTTVGQGTLTFSASNRLRFDYTIGTLSQSKQLEPLEFGTPTTCTLTANANLDGATNYTDVWNNNSEPGWGVHLTQQGNTIFGIWYTYDSTGRDQWIYAVVTAPTGSQNYSGELRLLSGVVYSSINDTQAFTATPVVGNVSFNFTNGTTATMTYTLNGITQIKALKRFVFSAPATICR